jgi:hypothetical protein
VRARRDRTVAAARSTGDVDSAVANCSTAGHTDNNASLIATHDSADVNCGCTNDCISACCGTGNSANT